MKQNCCYNRVVLKSRIVKKANKEKKKEKPNNANIKLSKDFPKRESHMRELSVS